LEKAKEADPERAAADVRWLVAMARGYVLAARFTEAFWLVGQLEASGESGPQVEALRERLLFESGLGRARLVSAVPIAALLGRLEPAAGTRLDVSLRKALDRLNELLARGLDPGPDGVTLLVPEGRFEFSLNADSLAAPKGSVPLDVWAGDEVTLRLIPVFPDPAVWSFDARSRSIIASWPPVEGASYRLYRTEGDLEKPIYQGAETRFTDTGLTVGTRVAYRLDAINALGELVATSWAVAETLPPASEVRVEAELGDDLRVRVSWAVGPGAADRVRVIRRGAEGDQLIADTASVELLHRGRVNDGPFPPAEEARELRYRVEIWVTGDESSAAAAEVDVEVPPRVVRVSQISESIDRGSVVVLWATLPREGIADGYAVFRVRDDELAGELVGRVEDPFAREFVYPVDNPLEASDWRHFVVPYVGDRYFLDPEFVEIRGEVPQEEFRTRKRKGKPLPDLGLSWDPYPGASLYAVEIGEREVLVKKPYVEMKGLQTSLMATDHLVSVYAVDAENRRIPLLTLDLRYQHYRRSKAPREQQ
jgi:hypothetical protein